MNLVQIWLMLLLLFIIIVYYATEAAAYSNTNIQNKT